MKTVFKKLISATVALTLVSGCAVSSSEFYRQRLTMSNAQLCRTFASSEDKVFQEQSVDNEIFANDVRVEINRRNLSHMECKQIVSGQNLAIGAGALLGAALIAVARRNGGGGGGGGPAKYDTEWDWDEFYNGYHQLVWACRGVQTGQFADEYHCAGKLQTDNRWPGK